MIEILTPVSCAAVMGVESARAFAMSTRLPAVLPIDSVMLLPAQIAATNDSSPSVGHKSWYAEA